MRLHTLFALTLTLACASRSQAKLEAHEWGTFTSLVGSNGVTQSGMHHEDEALPSFVHGFGETLSTLPQPVPPPPDRPCRSKACFSEAFITANPVTQKMETPVIYFYSDRLQNVEVNVKFPEGVVTETFPAPILTSPTRKDLVHLGNGDTTFKVDVLPRTAGMLPVVPSGNIYSHARNVESNVVRSGGEEEKFIFYRGLGRFQPAFSIGSKNGDVSLYAKPSARPQAAFLVDVNSEGHGQLMNVMAKFQGDQAGVVSAALIRKLQDHTGSVPTKNVKSGEQARSELVNALVIAGLNLDEALAMIKTWEHGYLKVPGLRLIYILPRTEADQILPLTISPTPEKVERVFVGRIEILTDTQELKILNDILTARNNFDVKRLGRFGESMLRRVREVYFEQQDQRDQPPATDVVATFDQLIKTAAGEHTASLL